MHPAINISSESARGCGYRKKGGIYLCAEGIGRPCGKLPLPLEVCPTCGGGIHFCRSWTWVNATAIFAEKKCSLGHCHASCPLANANEPLGRAGLLWIGEKSYPTPADWTKEALKMGVSRRISTVPRDLVIGETWVLVAHNKCIENPDGSWSPGIFHVFRPERIEVVVDGTESDEEIEALVERDLVPVLVRKKEFERGIDED